MRLRLTKVDEFQFLTCLQHDVWGSNTRRFKDWRIGDQLVIIVNKALAGLGEVSGKPFVSKQRVWDNGIFPHRIPIRFTHVLLPENRPSILGEVRETLTTAWGPSYGWGILNQQLLTNKPAEIIVKAIRSHPNDLDKIRSNLDGYLTDAKLQREALATIKTKPERQKKVHTELPFEEKTFPSKEAESTHSKSQSLLIRLGKTTGCAVWVASNDRNRLFKGKCLGDGCLTSLPKLGLSEEASKRISLIDVIWIRQSAPVCAFEVEASTTIYSGLLRMSDLLSVVPALNIKLFIVASRERQDKVMAELARPTFQKIGLNEYCRFIATEDLDTLYSRVAGLEGHVQPSIVDSVAVGLEESENTPSSLT